MKYYFCVSIKTLNVLKNSVLQTNRETLGILSSTIVHIQILKTMKDNY